MVHRSQILSQAHAAFLESRYCVVELDESTSHFFHKNVTTQHRDFPEGAYIGRAISTKPSSVITRIATVIRCNDVICLAPSTSRFESTGTDRHFASTGSKADISLTITPEDDKTGRYFITEEEPVTDMETIEDLVGKTAASEFAWTKAKVSWKKIR